jgi:Kdo2-lipid IVA lauroyltransferase/acyltransferase
MVKYISICLSILPYSIIALLSKALGFFMYYIVRYRRKVINRNLIKAFGDNYSDKQRDNIGYKSLCSFIQTELELLASRSGKLGDGVKLIGREHIEKALSEGKGAYILCVHMGSWEAMGSGMNRQVGPTHVIVKNVGGAKTDKYFRWIRKKNGFISVERKKKGDAFKAIKRVLGNNELLGFVMDQSRPGEPKLPFFGHPAKTNTSFAAILKRNPAPVIPGYCIRTGPGEYEVTFEPKLEIIRTDNTESDVLENSKMFNRVVESLITKCPEQYFWVHNRWK